MAQLNDLLVNGESNFLSDISLTNSSLQLKGGSGDWNTGCIFSGASGTKYSGFQANGTGDTLNYLYVGGSTTNPWFKVDSDEINVKGKFYGAVWNDYAEYRNQIEKIEPGYCVTCDDDGKVYKTDERLSICEGVVSDTYGFAIGRSEQSQTPIAVSGRVLVYTFEDVFNFHSGDVVCAGPEGKVSLMTRDEIIQWPDRIVGIVSEIPKYQIWGSNNIKVNGRIWIKVR